VLMNVLFVGNEPLYMTDGAAGADLAASWGHEIPAGGQVMIDTGTSIAVPEGFVGLLAPRSSLCNKGGLMLVNSLGVLDSDYTGSIKFCYKNTGWKSVFIDKGERIGQVLIMPLVKASFKKVDSLEATGRGSGGFGSTNK
jgi:dUTP pyrophosphatase